MELYFTQSFRRPLIKHKVIIGSIESLRNLREFTRIKEVIRHKFNNQSHVDMNCSFQLRQCSNISSCHAEIHISFKTFGRYNIPDIIDHMLAFSGYFHFHHRIKKQVSSIFCRCRTHIICCSKNEQSHRY